MKQQFSNSAEATDFMYKLQEMLKDPRLAHWVKATDDSCDTDTNGLLKRAERAYDIFLIEMENAE